MTQREEHERYLLEVILSDSISSDNPSEKAKEKARKNSPSYFKALEENLLVKYENKKLSDISGSKIIDTDAGETLCITESEKINFKLAENNFKQQMNHNLKLLPKIGIKQNRTLKMQDTTPLNHLLLMTDTDHMLTDSWPVLMRCHLGMF